MPETKFFQACRGVFEGGGCRGAAHVGAFEAAVNCGINFSEVAGTSAGSIIAALIGAGATPEFMLEKCARKDFSELLAPPKGRIETISGSGIGRFVSAPFGPWMSAGKQLVREIVTKGAAYSSERIETWVDELLAELLPGAQRPIKFKELILPTYIVATDLAGQRPKIWSTRDTPDAVVAFAVRCSSSIPLFFEPVESGNTVFVDGGMLSNLPAFVFAGDKKDANSLGGRVLAIRLVEDDDPNPEWSLGWLLPRLIGTAISGATEIQSNMMRNVSTVNVSTGSISGMNFELSDQDIEFLIESGRQTIDTFVRNEHAKLNDSLVTEAAKYSQDELYDELVRVMLIPGKRLVVSQNDTRWFWRLFPVAAHWLFNGAQIDVIVGPVSGDTSTRARENQRRNVLRKLGVRLTERPDVDINCFLVRHDDNRNNALFIDHISQTEHSPYGVAYVGVYHRTLIGVAEKSLDERIDAAPMDPPELELRVDDPTELINLLKIGVLQYRNASVRASLQEIPIGGLGTPRTKLIVRRVRSFKYRQIPLLAELYRNAGIELFKAATIYANGERVSTITPPVLEIHGDDRVAVEGNTRLYQAYRLGITKASAIVVEGVTDPLPGTPSDLSHVLLSTSDIPSEERIENFSYTQFRSIEGAARPIDE